MKPMSKVLFITVSSFALVSCRATARFYPVQGPLAEQTPPPVYVGKISGAFYSGNMTVTGKQGEVFRGRWEAVRQPAKSTDAPKIAPSDTEMSALWDSIYGDGFYVANVLGTRLYGRGFLKTSNGDTLKVEFYRPEKATNDANAIRGSIKGVGKDDKGNVYKITFS
ncbi:MAG TPA: hypothetical protein VKD70_18280 [Candidatus Acidoferrum sp.]|nr:hypothetical protein [Candidatus Acidoferrum sp.]